MPETSTPVLLTFRDTLRKHCPPWLQRGLAEKLLYSIGVHCDAFSDALVAAAKQRFPGYYSFDSLPLLGRERRITRGRSESDENYAARIARFFSDHQLRGGPYALLSQLFIHYTPDTFPIDLIYYAGSRRFQMDVGGDVTRDLVTWTPDTNAAKWARWWLFYYTDQWAVTPPSAAELQDLRLIPRQWNAAHPLGYIVLFPAGAEMWNFPLGRLWNRHVLWNNPVGGLTIEVG